MTRRRTRAVPVGGRVIGGAAPLLIQSMTTARPDDTTGLVAECERLAAAGCELIRLSTPTVADAERLGEVKLALRARGLAIPLAADIHFLPAAALAAAEQADKIRINPGNFADRKTGRAPVPEDEREAPARREAAFAPLLVRLARSGAALRLGVNHGSLSDRILARYGDTPAGMVESALEYARFARDRNFHRIVFSLKSSNPRLMAIANRQLVDALEREGMDYPLHLGVTEAGEGEDGRIRSAIGIGALLADGLGDTIRVSLAEPPEREIPVARELVAFFASPAGEPEESGPREWRGRRATDAHGLMGGEQPVRIAGDYAEATVEGAIPCEIDSRQEAGLVTLTENDDPAGAPRAAAYRLILTRPALAPHVVRRAARALGRAPLLLVYRSPAVASELAAAVVLGVPLLEGLGDAIAIEAPDMPAAARHALALGILQHSQARRARVEIIACPTCGRTLFDLAGVVPEIRRRFGHLVGVKIAVMGCIVNGPGEMADADFGFVGGGPGLINLYRGRECVEKNVPIAEAFDRLGRLIELSAISSQPSADS